jgi:hypothetical protein
MDTQRARRGRLAFGSGVVDRNIATTEARTRLIDQASHIVFVAHVGTPIFGFRSQGADFGNQCFASFVTSTRDNDARTVFREGQGCGSPNSCESSSDQNDLAAHWTLLCFILC